MDVFCKERISELCFESRVWFCLVGEVWKECWLEMDMSQRMQCEKGSFEHCSYWMWPESKEGVKKCWQERNAGNRLEPDVGGSRMS